MLKKTKKIQKNKLTNGKQESKVNQVQPNYLQDSKQVHQIFLKKLQGVKVQRAYFINQLKAFKERKKQKALIQKQQIETAKIDLSICFLYEVIRQFYNFTSEQLKSVPKDVLRKIQKAMHSNFNDNDDQLQFQQLSQSESIKQIGYVKQFKNFALIDHRMLCKLLMTIKPAKYQFNSIFFQDRDFMEIMRAIYILSQDQYRKMQQIQIDYTKTTLQNNIEISALEDPVHQDDIQMHNNQNNYQQLKPIDQQKYHYQDHGQFFNQEIIVEQQNVEDQAKIIKQKSKIRENNQVVIQNEFEEQQNVRNSKVMTKIDKKKKKRKSIYMPSILKKVLKSNNNYKPINTTRINKEETKDQMQKQRRSKRLQQIQYSNSQQIQQILPESHNNYQDDDESQKQIKPNFFDSIHTANYQNNIQETSEQQRARFVKKQRARLFAYATSLRDPVNQRAVFYGMVENTIPKKKKADKKQYKRSYYQKLKMKNYVVNLFQKKQNAF